MKKRFLNFWFAPSDTIRLDTFRMLLGAALLLYMRERWLYASEWLTPAGFHVSAENLPYHPFFAPLLSESFLPIFGFVLFGSIAAFTIGWQLRWTIWIAFVCLVYVTMADQLAAFTLNKLSIVALLTMGLAAKGRYWSVDKTTAPTQQSVWPIRILQITLLVHYFTAGWSKAMFGDWLTNPLALWSQLQGYYRTDIAAWLLQVSSMAGWAIMQYGALAFELFAPVLFVAKATRRIAFLWGTCFQLLIAVTMHQLIYFMLVMFCFYPLFMKESTLHRIREFLSAKILKINHAT